MKLEAEKLELIQWIIEIQDQNFLRELLKISKSTGHASDDPWEKLPIEEREAILQGIASLERGDYHEHEAVMKEMKSEFGF